MLSKTGGRQPFGLPFAAALTERDGTAILSVTGDADMAAAQDLRVALEDMAAGGLQRRVIDLTHVTYMDSVAIGMLIGAHKLTEPGVQLVVVCPESLANLFRVAGLFKVLDVRPTLGAALI